jgi:type IV secretion system protein VirD4
MISQTFGNGSGLRRGIEFGFIGGQPLVYQDIEPTCIDAQMGKGKFTRFIGVNLVSPRTGHFTKIITDPKDGELAWSSWGTLKRQGYAVRFINAGGLYGYASERYNPSTRVLEVARNPRLHEQLDEAAKDAASFLIPLDPDPRTRWIGQGVRTMLATFFAITARFPSNVWTCSPGGAWDFFGRGREDIADDLLVFSAQERLANYAGICRQIASWTSSPDQWNAYNSVIVECLQTFQPGTAARRVTDGNSFDPASMKHEKTALFIMGSARSQASRHFVGAMAAAIIERFADAHGPLRALVIGEEWGQLYVSNFYEILTLYRSAGVNFLGVFQNAGAQIEAKYGKDVLRLWKKAVAITLYRGLPDDETLREIEYLSGKASVMVRGFNASMSQVAGSGGNPPIFSGAVG